MLKCPTCRQGFENIRDFPEVRVLEVRRERLPTSVSVMDKQIYGYGFFKMISRPDLAHLDSAAFSYAKKTGQLGREFAHEGVIYKPTNDKKIYTAHLDVTSQFNEAVNSAEVKTYLDNLKFLQETQKAVPFDNLELGLKPESPRVRGHDIYFGLELFTNEFDGRWADMILTMPVDTHGFDMTSPHLARVRLEGVLPK